MNEEVSIHPDDLPPIWTEKVSSVQTAFAFVLMIAAMILLFVSPALVIAVWRWAL